MRKSNLTVLKIQSLGLIGKKNKQKQHVAQDFGKNSEVNLKLWSLDSQAPASAE
jgi:hypothetical protein